MPLGPPVRSDMVMPVVAEGMGLLIDSGRIGNEPPSFPAGNGLDIVEGETPDMPVASQGFPPVGAADRLAGIFQQDKAVGIGDPLKGAEVGHGTAHMHGHNHTGPGRDGTGDRLRIKGKGVVDIAKDRNSPHG